MTAPGGTPAIGLVLPTYEGSWEDRTPRWGDLVALAQRAEEMGIDSLWIADHLQVRTAEGSTGPWECWTLLSALAAVTSRVQLGTFVLGAAFRNPALVAKMADTLDEVSGGRLILGLGAGWHEPEYEAFGYPYDHRLARFEEALRITTGLLRDGRVDVDGRYWHARDAELHPRGPRAERGGPPIMVGTAGPPTSTRSPILRLAARYGDLHNEWGKSLATLPARLALLDDACREVGRDPATLARSAGTFFGHHPGREGAVPLDDRDGQLRTLREYAALGISHIQIVLEPASLSGLERFEPTLRALRSGDAPG